MITPTNSNLKPVLASGTAAIAQLYTTGTATQYTGRYKQPQLKGGNVLPLIAETDELLSEPSAPVDFQSMSFSVLEQLYTDLVNTMRNADGMGISAVQAGIPLRLFIIETGEEYPLGVFNPKIVETGEDVILEEGCLSFPKLLVKVKRPKTVTLRFQLIDGSWRTQSFTGISARCVQHELDHLDGLTMKDRANKIHWDAAVKKRKKS